MPNWITSNWDKVIAIALSVLFSGLVGFFSGLRAVDSQISALSQRVVELETISKTVVAPKISTVDDNENSISRLELRVDNIDGENAIHKATYELLRLKREEAQGAVIEGIKEIIETK